MIPAELNSIVNASRFMFQTAVETAIEVASYHHPFAVEAREHRRHPEGGVWLHRFDTWANYHPSGKRRRDASWIFLEAGLRQLPRGSSAAPASR